MPGIYNFCWYFLIFSFVGWTIETTLVSFQQKHFVNRGFLAGPICPIYGSAMCLIILALTPVKLTLLAGGMTVGGVLLLLLVSAVIACVVEYFVGFLLEKMFHQRWWDYSDHKINLNGRIAVPESLAWGPLATAAILFLVPWLDSVIALIPPVVGYAALAVVAVIILLDVLRILQKMSTFDRLAESLRAGADEFRALMAKIIEVESLKQRERRKRRVRRADKLRARLSAAYPKLGEKWGVIRDERRIEDDLTDKKDEK